MIAKRGEYLNKGEGVVASAAVERLVIKRVKSPQNLMIRKSVVGFPGGTVVKNLPANAGDTGSSPGPGRSHMLQSN